MTDAGEAERAEHPDPETGPDRSVFEFICNTAIPHNRELGIRLVDVRRAEIVLELPYADQLVGNPTTGVIAGGAITSLLDATCGMAVMAATARPKAVATLDLRIDYLRPATPGLAVRAHAHCHRITRHVAFVRAEAYHEGAEELVASAAGSFMLNTPGKPLAESGS